MGAETGDSFQERRKRFLAQNEKLKATTAKIRRKVAVMSGKGGVGKSTVAANLAIAFAGHGPANRVGILDADIHGPSIPKLLGLSGERLQIGSQGIFPVIGPLGIRVVSMDFLLPEAEAPVIWRGPLKMTAIRQFLCDVVWGELDVLVIDLPPGTGDEPLSIAQLLPNIDGVIIVTIPAELSQIVVKKAITFANRLNMPIIGVMENMSGFICPHCGTKTDIFRSGGGKRVAQEMGVPYLGSIPIDQSISQDSDRGEPFILTNPESTASRAFLDITRDISEFLEKRKGKE